MTTTTYTDIRLPEIAAGSLEEAQLFIAGVAAHLTLDLPLTSHVKRLAMEIQTDSAFKSKVQESFDAYKADGAIKGSLITKLADELGLIP